MFPGRVALPKPPTPIRSWRRYLASSVEQSYTNPYQDQQFIEGGVGESSKSQAVTSLSTRDQQIEVNNEQVARDWAFFHHQKLHTDRIGSAVGPHYKPHELLSNPPWPKDITLELLMASQAHIGHATSLWHPANAKYIFGVRGEQDPIHIISLDVTAAHLRRACKIVRGVTERGGLVLFVGSREGQARAVVKAAEMSKGCHLFGKWIPGSITNGQQILGKCRKRVVNEFDEEVEGFEDQLLQKAALKPDLVVCLNPLENYVLLHECGLNNIPTVGIIDTDANPTWVTYPIPANDDSLRCVQLMAGTLGRAGQEGQEIRQAKAGRGIIDYRQNHGLQPPSEEDEEAKQKREKEQSLLAGADAFDITQFADEEPETTTATADQQANAERLGEIQGLDKSLQAEEMAFDQAAPLDGGEDLLEIPKEVGRVEYTGSASGEGEFKPQDPQVGGWQEKKRDEEEKP